jgi:hypothetical protein
VDKRAGVVEALVGVCAKVVALGLEEVGREALRAVAVIERQRSAKCGDWDAEEGCLRDNDAPRVLAALDGLGKEVVEEQVGQLRVLLEGIADVAQEAAADDAAATSHEGNGREVELPAKLLRRLAHQHESLRV